jgi:hypothetical protein
LAESQSYFTLFRALLNGLSEQAIVKPGCGSFLQFGFVPSASMSIGGKRRLIA